MKNKMTYGVGYDSGGIYPKTVKNKHTKEYAVWYSIMNRCYSPKYLEKRPTYKGCEVCLEWHDFQNFAKWFSVHGSYEKGFQIDKDLLCLGNKIYSPETTCFVPSAINNLVIDSGTIRGDTPIGVSFRNDSGSYKAQINISGKTKNIGSYSTAQEAHQAYVIAKEAYVKEVANKWRSRIDERVYDALIKWRVNS